jgi:hypothetical protein
VALHVAATLRHYAWLMTQRRYSSRGCNIATLRVADDAAALQLAWVQRCDAVACVFFFFLNDFWQVQEFSTSSCTCEMRETESKKE